MARLMMIINFCECPVTVFHIPTNDVLDHVTEQIVLLSVVP